MARELTGRHVLYITLGAFGTIIAVNVTMAVMAVGTFPGLEVRNSYVASQSFDADRAAQQALNWTVVPEYDGRVMTLIIRDAQGYPAPVQTLEVTVGRPTHQRDDQAPEFTYSGGLFRAPLELAPGLWNIRLSATAPDGTVFRQRIDQFSGNRVK
ncbi:Nitrogen fixation protein FixH [Paracoccus halophilus]|uniref:FixH protein n=1 Tax=Paracoccus halophilus TaxID=376733 RepID=A0A099F3V8_9RHOB|nr:FixH family protein [Paracoccus halophilus]KGJ04963.1 FixH protein [Paracoccus halophilus]SFA39403.1 Nitrogen fixation protein FixH [Paracoccus halophilus]